MPTHPSIKSFLEKANKILDKIMMYRTYRRQCDVRFLCDEGIWIGVDLLEHFIVLVNDGHGQKNTGSRSDGSY